MWRRLPGKDRRYINVSDPAYPVGHILSRRQYDKHMEKQGKRKKLSPLNVLSWIGDRISDLKHFLTDTFRPAPARERAAQELHSAEQSRASAHRRARQRAGQNVYNHALDAYVRREREAGRPTTKRAARSSPEFRQIMREIKPRKLSKNPNNAARQRQARQAAYGALGGANDFWATYDKASKARAA
jgi:hypothetical protein